MAKKKSIITNAMRILTSQKIPFEAVEYQAEEVGENFGVHIAQLTGIPCEMSFKTLVAKGNDYMVVCIPVDREVDLKKLAKVFIEASSGDIEKAHQMFDSLMDDISKIELEIHRAFDFFLFYRNFRSKLNMPSIKYFD